MDWSRLVDQIADCEEVLGAEDRSVKEVLRYSSLVKVDQELMLEDVYSRL